MHTENNLLSGAAPITVLALLRDGDKYGFELIEALAKRADNTFHLHQGTLYPVLHSLEKSGFIKSYIATAPTGRDRKYYRLTRSGGRHLRHMEKKHTYVSGQVSPVIRPVSY